jgi:beta-lactamase class A
VKSHPLLFLVVLVSCITATFAHAAPGQRYDLAYTWDTDIQRVLDYRQRVAGSLALASDSQLKIVGRDQEYGVVAPLNGTLAQAKSAAEQQARKLRRVGLKAAMPTRASSYQPLYHIQYSKGSNLQGLMRDYNLVKTALGGQVDLQLSIDVLGRKTYGLVNRCWAGKAEAMRIVQRHRPRLQGKQFVLTLIPATDRPSAQGSAMTTARSGLAPERRTALLDQVRTALQNEQPKATGPVGDVASGPVAGVNTKINSFLSTQKAKGRLRNKERAALVAYDLSSNSYVASVNAQRSFQAASMIKPFVALAFFHQVDKGKATYTPQHRRMMEAMIQHSSNEATNWFIRQLGGPARCEALLKKEFGRLLKQVRIREYIPPGGKTYKNSVPPTDYIQFLRALWNYQLPNSKEMLRVMSLPGPDRILCGTEIPAGTQVYNKTGTTSLLCGDMGILVMRSRDGHKIPFAIVGIVERSSPAPDYKQWMASGGGVIRDFSSLVYGEMKRKYNLL